jgi:hypothetical protein
MNKNSQLSMVAGILMAIGLFATEVSSQARKILAGYLVDKQCASFYVESHPEKLSEHSIGCVLACGGKDGFGVIADGRFYPFQKNGTLARQKLEKSSKEKDLRVVVTVVEDAGMFTLESID